jgi:hypothetical protein
MVPLLHGRASVAYAYTPTRSTCFASTLMAALLLRSRSKWYQCYTDEHYFATVLALYGHQQQTDCLGHSVAADWSVHSSHPHSYEPAEVSAALCVPASARMVRSQRTLHACGDRVCTYALSRALSSRYERILSGKVCDMRLQHRRQIRAGVVFRPGARRTQHGIVYATY